MTVTAASWIWWNYAYGSASSESIPGIPDSRAPGIPDNFPFPFPGDFQQ